MAHPVNYIGLWPFPCAFHDLRQALQSGGLICVKPFEKALNLSAQGSQLPPGSSCFPGGLWPCRMVHIALLPVVKHWISWSLLSVWMYHNVIEFFPPPESHAHCMGPVGSIPKAHLDQLYNLLCKNLACIEVLHPDIAFLSES